MSQQEHSSLFYSAFAKTVIEKAMHPKAISETEVTNTDCFDATHILKNKWCFLSDELKKQNIQTPREPQ